MWLRVLSLLSIWVGYKIPLAIRAILSIHVVLRTWSSVNRLRKRGRGSRIGATVCCRLVEIAIIVPEIQVKTIAVGVHFDYNSQLADEVGMIVEGRQKQRGEAQNRRGDMQSKGAVARGGAGERQQSFYPPHQRNQARQVKGEERMEQTRAGENRRVERIRRNHELKVRVHCQVQTPGLINFYWSDPVSYCALGWFTLGTGLYRVIVLYVGIFTLEILY